MKHKSEGCHGRLKASIILVLTLGFIHASFSFSLQRARLSFIGSCRDPSNTNESEASRVFKCFAIKNIHKLPIKRRDTTVAMVSPAASAGISKTIASLHTDNSFIFTILTIVSACGIAMEQQTTLGKALSVSKSKFMLMSVSEHCILSFVSYNCYHTRHHS